MLFSSEHRPLTGPRTRFHDEWPREEVGKLLQWDDKCLKDKLRGVFLSIICFELDQDSGTLLTGIHP